MDILREHASLEGNSLQRNSGKYFVDIGRQKIYVLFKVDCQKIDSL